LERADMLVYVVSDMNSEYATYSFYSLKHVSNHQTR
jgi:hypothetical protein